MSEQAKEHPKDICECGDFRRQHDERGVCQICSWNQSPKIGACLEFRLADKATAKVLRGLVRGSRQVQPS